MTRETDVRKEAYLLGEVVTYITVFFDVSNSWMLESSIPAANQLPLGDVAIQWTRGGFTYNIQLTYV